MSKSQNEMYDPTPDLIDECKKLYTRVEELEKENREQEKMYDDLVDSFEELREDNKSKSETIKELTEALRESLEKTQKADYLYREDRKFFYNQLCSSIDFMKAALSKAEQK